MLFVAIVTAGDRVPDEQLLFQDLMVGYEKSVRPVINSSTVLTVTLGLKLNQIVDLVSFPYWDFWLHIGLSTTSGTSSSYGSWIYNYLCNQCLSPLTLWLRIPPRRGVLDTTLCDKVCQWLATGRWFSPVIPFSSSNKTGRYDNTQLTCVTSDIIFNLLTVVSIW